MDELHYVFCVALLNSSFEHSYINGNEGLYAKHSYYLSVTCVSSTMGS